MDRRFVVELPAGTVTFLFTDIEGSTRLRDEHPDAMRDALARHDELLRAAIEANDGVVVKTTGDRGENPGSPGVAHLAWELGSTERAHRRCRGSSQRAGQGFEPLLPLHAL
jgi:class 3 adenylate cyclase